MTMNAVVQTGYGDPHDVLSLTTTELPTVGTDDVLVRVHATSVNTPDWASITGVPRILRLQSGLFSPATAVPGTDLAGIVAAVGENVTDLRPGDEVFGSAWAKKSKRRAGTFAEFTVTPATKLIRKPTSVSFEEAAASVMSGITALIAIRDAAEVKPGTRVLINGASGGVGTFAVQIAKTRGAHVTGVCSATNAGLVCSLGADEIIDYTEHRFVDTDERYDVVLDNVMNHPPSHVARVLAKDGVLIPNSLGNSGGVFAGLPRMARAAIVGLGPKNVRFANGVVDRDNLAEIATLLTSGDVRAVIDSTHPLHHTSDAVANMLSHRAKGNIVIAPVKADG